LGGVSFNRLASAAGRDVLVYQRTEKALLDDEAPDFEGRRERKRRVRQFFDRFRNADGSFNAGASSYVVPADLKERLGKDLKALVARRLATIGLANGLITRGNHPEVREGFN
jgi:hypothetical protein